MKKYILLSGLLVAGTMAFAQAEFDALKYSLNDINGSARYVSMSGAFGALGGDMTTLSMNPAGIAVYRSSELAITPTFTTNSTESMFNRVSGTSSKNNLMISNFGYVGSFRTYDESDISNFNFGVSYNKLKDYNRNVNVLGVKHPYSLLDRICEDQNIGSSNLYNYAHGAKLVNKNQTTDLYESILNPGETVDNTMNLMEKGGIGEWDFSLGANYGHMFYFGLSLGVQNIDYELESVYNEAFEMGGDLELRNVLTTKGTGYNLKVGTIIRPIPELRLGFSYQSPTYYTMTDVYYASMSSAGLIDPATNQKYNPNPYYDEADGEVKYEFKNPSRLMYSMAYQFGKKGFLSMDCDLVDYRETALSDANGVPYGDTNSYMNEDFRAAFNLRLGGELRLTDNVSLRAGTAWYESPVKDKVETSNITIVTAGTTPQYSVEKDTYYLSCGLGYRTGAFFLDAALQRQIRNENLYNYYDSTDKAAYDKFADVKTFRNSLVVSMGFKF